MFLCRDCHAPNCTNGLIEAMVPSRGPCENCGTSGGCFDCHGTPDGWMVIPGASLGFTTPEQTQRIFTFLSGGDEEGLAAYLDREVALKQVRLRAGNEYDRTDPTT